MKPVVIGSAAGEEIEEGVAFYNGRRPGKGDEFRDVVEAAVAVIGRRPRASSPYGRRYRKKVLSGFPYSIFYAEYPAYIWVAAVYHSSREPDAWMDREPD